ncbi:MAG: hypothetical protein ABW252_06700 [Polyangiales bacterium]
MNLFVLLTKRRPRVAFGQLACVASALIVLGGCEAAPDVAAPTEPVEAQAQQSAEPVVGTTQAIAAVAGRFSTPAPTQPRLRFYAADLGWAFQHGDALWTLFGDSFFDGDGTPLLNDADDALGKISLRDFPNADAVDRWLAAHPAADVRTPWRAPAPPMEMSVDARQRATPMRVVRDGQTLRSPLALTPVTGFSNARRDASGGAFAIFFRNDPVQCGTDHSCGGGFDCDEQLGRCAPVRETSLACVIGTRSCRCVKVGTGTGLCVDKGSSLYDPSTERGRANAVVVKHEVGNARPETSHIFDTRSWATHRFFNPTARTVNDFHPMRARGEGNDYGPADGVTPESEGVFVWGRPNFGGIGAKNRDAQVYLAWVPMPSYDRAGKVQWEPRHFAGVDADGRPTFSTREVDGVALDLDAETDGVQPHEAHDVIGQMSISWVPSLKRFVMMYGGDIAPSYLDLIFGPEVPDLRHHPLSPIFIRYAEQPWGPWTRPQILYAAGDVKTGSGQYGPGGVLHHVRCTQATCAPSEPALTGTADENGRLYGPAIIEPWTRTHADGGVDLYWNMSTWNPYQVLLMKTHLPPLAAAPR